MTMIKNLFAATLLVASFGANAIELEIGNADFTDVTNQHFGDSVYDGSGAFKNTYTFSFLTGQTSTIMQANFSIVNGTIDDFMGILYKDGASLGTYNITDNYNAGNFYFGEGEYILRLIGEFGSNGGYTWGVSPVPEPSVLGLMFGGLGLVGMVAYRARKTEV